VSQVTLSILISATVVVTMCGLLCSSMQLMLAKTESPLLELVENLHSHDAASLYIQVIVG
jgi:hypothetical protein